MKFISYLFKSGISGRNRKETPPKSQVYTLHRHSIEEFKADLDQFLEKIPDQPKSEGYIPNACNQSTARPSNSILDQCMNTG